MEQLFGAISAVFSDIPHDTIADEAIVFAAWSRCAGEMLRERTVPISFEKKRLIIAVEDITWQRHLEDLSPSMLAKINSSLGYGTVTFIEFRIDKKALNAKHTAEKAVIKRVPPVSKDLKNAANAIADEVFRENFLAAASVYLDRQRTDRSQI
ncbi:MAG: DUF721 domain-containing protein [Pyrinomonadaceae bacterium]